MKVLLDIQMFIGASFISWDKAASLKLLAVIHAAACRKSEILGDEGLLRRQKMHNFMKLWVKVKAAIVPDERVLEVIHDLADYFKPYSVDVELDQFSTELFVCEGYEKNFGSHGKHFGKKHPQAMIRWAYNLFDLPAMKSFERVSENGRYFLIKELLADEFDYIPANHLAFPARLLINSIYIVFFGMKRIDKFKGSRTCHIEISGSVHLGLGYLQFSRYASSTIFKLRSRYELDLNCLLDLGPIKIEESFNCARMNVPTEERVLQCGRYNNDLHERLLRSLEYGLSVHSQSPDVIIYLLSSNIHLLEKKGFAHTFMVLALLRSCTQNDLDSVLSIPFRKALLRESFRNEFSAFIEKGMQIFGPFYNTMCALHFYT